MNLTFQIYDAFGDWISANGLIRHLAEGYETVTLIHDTPAVVPFTTDMFRDNPKIKAIVGTPSGDCDVVDARVHENYQTPNILGRYFSSSNRLSDAHYPYSDNGSGFYAELGVNPEHRTSDFYYMRDLKAEYNLFEKINPPKGYSVICEMYDGMLNVDRTNVINLHRLTDNFAHTLKLIENAKEVHLIENSISLFLYHMQMIGAIDSKPITLHAYARKEPHRRCDGPDCDNPYLNMLKCPHLHNWNFIWQ